MTQPRINTLPETDEVTLRCDCPGCGANDWTDFFAAKGLPVHVGVLGTTPEEACGCRTGDVQLSFCHGCGLVYNRRFDPTRLEYKPGYEVALHHSATFCKFMEGLADRLIERFDIRGKNVLEIGCGCGYFLRMLCRRGGNDCTGIDPTVAKEGIEQIGEHRVRFIRDRFDERYTDVPADFICCLSVFEHIPEPLRFLANLRRMIGQHKPGMYFEIFNGLEAFRNEETWSIHYEQCNYFSRDSFAGVFERAGFEVLEAGACYEDGQYLHVDAVPHADGSTRPTPTERLPLPDEVTRFAQCHRDKLARWHERLDEYERTGRRVVLWGSGGKGISFLNMLPTEGRIAAVVDINPDRQDRFIPGTGHRIVAPESLVDDPPETIILTNALYEQEIKSQVQQLGVRCEFLTA